LAGKMVILIKINESAGGAAYIWSALS